MADDTHTSGSDSGATAARPTWHEREIALALQRLATAREHLAILEQRGAHAVQATETAAANPADVTRAHEVQADIDALRPKAAARFGGGAARARIDELEVSLHLVLDRLGFASYEQFILGATPPSAAPAVDPDALRFAQREFADAERSFLEVVAMVIPPNEPDLADLSDGADSVGSEVDETGHDAEILHFKADPAAS